MWACRSASSSELMQHLGDAILRYNEADGPIDKLIVCVPIVSISGALTACGGRVCHQVHQNNVYRPNLSRKRRRWRVKGVSVALLAHRRVRNLPRACLCRHLRDFFGRGEKAR